MQNKVRKYDIKPGDRVQHTDEMIEGHVISIVGETVTIRTDDGFDYQFGNHELIQLPGSEKDDLMKLRPSAHDIQEKQPKIHEKSSAKRSKGMPHVPEYDLHIEKLTDYVSRMDKSEILEFQLEYAKTQLELGIKNKTPKIVLIHGVGEGVLKQALLSLINQYEQLDPQPANPRKYGQGATLVYIRQQKN